jgi:hypothetical protein
MASSIATPPAAHVKRNEGEVGLGPAVMLHVVQLLFPVISES